MSLFTSLRYLVALHKYKHFGRAAEACHITQPALSNAIRSLETEFGTSIIKRGRTFESFTPEGEQIYLTAQRMLHEEELLKQTLNGSKVAPVGTLQMAAVPSVLPIAARFCGLMQKLFPGIIQNLRAMSSQEIETGLENLSLDLAFGYTQRIEGNISSLESLWQYNEHYFLLRRAEKPSRAGLKISRQPLGWKEAATHRLCLLTPEMHNRTIVNEAFAKAGVNVSPVIETNSILTLGLSVLVGDICSVLPGALVGVLSCYNELEAVPLNSPEVVTPIGLMYARTRHPSHTMGAALELARGEAWLNHAKSNSGFLEA